MAECLPSTSKTGNIYFYYICRGVQEHDCDLPALPVAKVERAVTNPYTDVAIPVHHHARLETLAAQACTDSREIITKMRTGLRHQLAELDQQEDRYLDLLGDRTGHKPNSNPDSATSATANSAPPNSSKTPPTVSNPGAPFLPPLSIYSNGRANFTTPPPTTPANSSINDSHEHRPDVTADDLNEPFASLVHATRTTSPIRPPRSTQNAPLNRLSGLLACALTGQSASKAAMVETKGLEPSTPALQRRCSTS
jgi:site-specific DNA recombinase